MAESDAVLSRPPGAPLHKVLVANRGAVAVRIMRALRALSIVPAAVYSEADAGAPWLEMADESYLLGPAPAAQSYLNQDRLIDVLVESGADGVHPGYGFLAENATFAQRVIDAGACFIGPSPHWIDVMGHKTHARALMSERGLPLARGSGILGDDPHAILQAAAAIGYPVLDKPAAGGGGIGRLPAHDDVALLAAVGRARSLAQRTFGNGEVYLEKLFERPRHIEFQMLGDRAGAVRHLFERDCSLQRRHQKIVEEAPAPGLTRDAVEALAARTAQSLQELGYDNIGTVEMLHAGGQFSFLEMNTRLQVEHAVTEEVTGIDLVVAQIRAAAGAGLDELLPPGLAVRRHAVEARVYAEDPHTFMPSPGLLNVFRPPAAGPAVRVETGYRQGGRVTPYYDPLIAKVIVSAERREQAIQGLIDALRAFEIDGIRTNLPFLTYALGSDEFLSGDVHTGLAVSLAERFRATSAAPSST